MSEGPTLESDTHAHLFTDSCLQTLIPGNGLFSLQQFWNHWACIALFLPWLPALPLREKLFCRAIGATEYDANEGNHHAIDAATRDPATHHRVAAAKVLVVTTGTAFKAVDHWHPQIASHFGSTCLFVHDESQQGAELLSISAVAMTRIPCFVIYMGDSHQSPGGLRETCLAQYLRGELLRLPIGLRAGQKSRTPANLGVALARTAAQAHGLDVSDLLAHAGAVSNSSVMLPWALDPQGPTVVPSTAATAARSAKSPITSHAQPEAGQPQGSFAATYSSGEPLGSLVQFEASDPPGAFASWVLQVASECNRVYMSSPVGTVLTIAHLLLKPGSLLTLQHAISCMECCGLSAGVHEWGLTLSTTSRVPNPVYEALIGTLYPELVQHNQGEWQFGTGTRNYQLNEPHGFRYVFWNRQRRGRAPAKAIVAAVHEAFEIFSHIPCFHDTKPGATPGQIIITNTRFQRDSLAHHIPIVPFESPVPNPAYMAPPIEGRDADGAQSPAPKRVKGGKSSGKSPEEPSRQPEFLSVVPTRVDTVVRLAGSTCYRAFLLQDAVGFLSGRRSRAQQAQRSPHHARQAEVKRKEAFTRANVGLSRAIGTTIIISPLDMAGQPGACIVTAVLQTGLAVIDTNAYGLSHSEMSLDENIVADSEMEHRIWGMTFGSFPLLMALCWQKFDSATRRMTLHRLHLVLVEAANYKPTERYHQAYPGHCAMGVLWGYALDGEDKPLWEVRPDQSYRPKISRSISPAFSCSRCCRTWPVWVSIVATCWPIIRPRQLTITLWQWEPPKLTTQNKRSQH